jgi:hypothetical protein
MWREKSPMGGKGLDGAWRHDRMIDENDDGRGSKVKWEIPDKQ